MYFTSIIPPLLSLVQVFIFFTYDSPDMNIDLQVIIQGLVVYLIFSVIVYFIVEGIPSLFKLRGKALLNVPESINRQFAIAGLAYGWCAVLVGPGEATGESAQ